MIKRNEDPYEWTTELHDHRFWSNFQANWYLSVIKDRKNSITAHLYVDWSYIPSPRARRRAPEPWDAWKHQSPPEQGGEVQSCGTRGSAGALLSREAGCRAARCVAACGHTPAPCHDLKLVREVPGL
jgi:hypothetical protein